MKGTHRQAVQIDPAAMSPIATVGERFQSYNVEMAEVIGATFWRPYGKETGGVGRPRQPAPPAATPSGLDPALFERRPPIDLSDVRLRKLAAALGPAHVRVSGTWANTVYFHDSPGPAPSSPPPGFNGVLTAGQWTNVIEFARAVDARLITSFATGSGTRGRDGAWTADQARRLLARTESAGGQIAAAEFMNEPTYAAMGGAPDGYDAVAFGRDIAVFHRFLKQVSPGTVFLGPGSVGEPGSFGLPTPALRSEDLLAASGPVFDAFSYHFYGTVSQRCAPMARDAATTPEAALSEDWLARTETAAAFYAGLRDRFAPGTPLWVTETADAACGGNPWASTFLDTFRYVEQLGRLARRGVQVIAHNTLASSDYGLLDEQTLTPRPNYWAALLWRRLMGTTVLEPGVSPMPDLHVYAHSLRHYPVGGGIGLVVINTDRTAPQEIGISAESQRYALSAPSLLNRIIQLNGQELKLQANGDLPDITAVSAPPGLIVVPPASITFLAVQFR
jgi:heparanase